MATLVRLNPEIPDESDYSDDDDSTAAAAAACWAVWLTGNAFVSISEVTLRQTWLVLGWVTNWTGKPSWYVTSLLLKLLGLLLLLLLLLLHTTTTTTTTTTL